MGIVWLMVGENVIEVMSRTVFCGAHRLINDSNIKLLQNMILIIAANQTVWEKKYIWIIQHEDGCTNLSSMNIIRRSEIDVIVNIHVKILILTTKDSQILYRVMILHDGYV